ncbi:gamma-glutamyltransferase, partial [Myxococcota bacterium]|nr:gamma-glutamyltransferase [Myxococcota bacterium]
AEVARGKKGVVVSAHRDASRAGVEILKKGGNALDAAIATAYALAVVEPFSAGVGGGGFLLYFDAKTKKATVVDYREVAPKKATRDMFVVDGKVDPKRSTEGILAVGVPGMVPGLDAAQKRLGKKKLRDVLGPAIRLADEGFLVTPRFFEASVDGLELLRAHPETARVFLKDGAPYPIGERLFQPDLAKTLRDVAKGGARVFTHGRVAQAIAKESAARGGLLTLDDLRTFEARFREPLVGTFEDHTVLTMPPPSSGGVHLLQMLTMMDIDWHRRRDPDRRTFDAEDVHVLAEIMRRAYADRATFMGDPAFTKIPIAGLLDRDYLTKRYVDISRTHASPSPKVTAGAPKESPETTHLTVIDAAGNVAALTQTVNLGFGAGIVVPGTGVLLNNEMDDFAAAPGVPNAFGLVGGDANSVQPGKIPLSSMTPTIVLDRNGAVRLALGSPGGPTIITTVLQVIHNVIVRGMDVAHAVAAPRLHMQWLPDELRFEPGALDDALQAGLRDRGFTLRMKERWGNATAIEVLTDGTRVGAADPRGDGAGDAE